MNADRLLNRLWDCPRQLRANLGLNGASPCSCDRKLQPSQRMWSDRSLAANANNFGPLRLVLAVLVLYSHCYPLCGGMLLGRDPLGAATSGRWTIGTLAVDAFLAVSGFLVAHSWERSRSVGAFLMKRVRRVYPGFVTLMLLQAFVVAPVFAAVYRPYTASQLGRIGLETVDLVGYGFPYGGLLDPFPANPLPHQMNGSLWTIRYEFVCYLLLAGFGAAGLMRRRTWMLIIACLSVGMSFLIATEAVHLPWSRVLTAAVGIQSALFRFMGFFVSGTAFYLYRERLRFAVVPVVFVSALTLGSLFWSGAAHALLPVTGVYLLIWFAVQQRIRLAVLVERADISYGFYLYAFPIQQIVIQVSHRSISPVALFAIATPLTTAAATLSWFLVERPFLKSRTGAANATRQSNS
jgi:peptidoglycan/LPS O-acetylase OafA/YrhL